MESRKRNALDEMQGHREQSASFTVSNLPYVSGRLRTLGRSRTIPDNDIKVRDRWTAQDDLGRPRTILNGSGRSRTAQNNLGRYSDDQTSSDGPLNSLIMI